MKLLVKSDLFEVEVEGQTAQEVWQRAAFWHSLPTVCPVDGSPVRFGYANRGGYDFHFLESTGARRYEFPFGTDLESKSLFPGKVTKLPDGTKKTVQKWTYWDAENEREVIVWQDGRLIVDGAQSKAPAQRVVTSPADIDRALDEAAQGEVSQNGPHIQEDMHYQVALKMYEDLGLVAYGPGWANKSKEVAIWASGKRTYDAKALTLPELNKANVELNKVVAKLTNVAA